MDEIATNYEKLFETFALDDTVVHADPCETIKLRQTPAASLASLPPLSIADADDADGELRIGRTLGQGGMGLIREATQRPFDRGVALKTMRADIDRNDAMAFALLREAIAAGRLEHPNVVPIYAVGRDEDGQPIIVMKRIDGGSWREVLDAGTRSLDEHLVILQEVCQAVDFAHERGVLHRDLKPDNVMVDRLGDVYVVDWGLAVSLERDVTGRLPSVNDVKQVAGTPAYMAPEMAAGGAQPIDARADVYCLGAILHELVTGDLRHQGKTVYEMMLNAYRSEPVEYPPSVPRELADICNKATAHDPADRYQTAAELHAAIQAYLDHRSAAALTEGALAQVDELEAVLDDESLDSEERRVAVYRLYGAARFGLERSLAEWEEQPAALDGLQRTLELMCDWELLHGSTHAAAALLSELPEERPELVARLREVEAARASDQEELEKLRGEERERDISVGAQARAVQMLVLLVGIVGGPWASTTFFDWDPTAKPLHFWLVSVGASLWVALNLAVAWWSPWKPIAIAKTRLNFRLGMALNVVCVWLIIARGFGIVAGLSVPTELGLELIGFAGFTAMMAVTFDPLMIFAVGFFLGGAVLVHLHPEYAVTIYMVATLLALTDIAWVWRNMRKDPEAERPQ